MVASTIISNINHKINILSSCNLISYKNCSNSFNFADRLGIKSNLNVNSRVSRIVYWRKPEIPFVKLNTDGSVKRNIAGTGGIIRNFEGKVLSAFASPLNQCSVLTAELSAVAEGIEKCINLGYSNVWIEVNSQSVVNILNDKCQGNPYNFYLIRRIKLALSNINYKISHVLHEANSCADWLANVGC
ncbi:hypothetical protein KFK09_003013 [Dendrobium nobile]|uniref:RNase H type-1 domain-containing protein n=1 Tax=Dendrobium nobile TaxID=94219 RepID=A0A8T3C8V8_DENNO|nr:hypothetical protein KFK09_003013 [Dendrobium nobile]